jgi:hypothetical protein
MSISPPATPDAPLLNPFAILSRSLRLSIRTWQLWVLALLLYLVMIPALVLAGGLGVLSFYWLMPSAGDGLAGAPLAAVELPLWEGIAFIVVGFLLLVLASVLSWAVQAAMIRAAGFAADGRAASLRESLALGRQRWVSLVKLAFSFGLIIQALGVLPALLALLLRENTGWVSFGLPLVETFLSPFNIVLGVLVFLVMMSIALEDMRPRLAIRRVAALFRAGWWGFLLAYVIQAGLALAIAFVFAFILLIVVVIFGLGILGQSAVPTLIAGAICLLATPVGLALLTFVLVFSTVYFTLTYRAAAAQTAGTAPNPGG